MWFHGFTFRAYVAHKAIVSYSRWQVVIVTFFARIGRGNCAEFLIGGSRGSENLTPGLARFSPLPLGERGSRITAATTAESPRTPTHPRRRCNERARSTGRRSSRPARRSCGTSL